MKKFTKIFSIFALMMILCFSFVGCGEKIDENFYRTTSEKFSGFIQDICLNSDYENGVTYETNVSNIIQGIKNGTISGENVEKYTELETVYDSIFVASFHFLQAFSSTLSIAPTEVTENALDDYKELENQIDVIKNKFVEFESSLHELDITVINYDPFGIISLQNLRDYKRSLIDLCQEIVKLDNMFISICENYIFQSYDSFLDEQGNYIQLDETAIRNQKNLAHLKSAVATITPAITYLNAFDGNYVKLNTDKFFTTLDEYSKIEIVGDTALAATIQELESFLKIYSFYQNDLKLFYESVENVNFKDFERCNFDPTEYAENDSQKFAYANKILSFSSKSVESLYQINNLLCA